MKIPGWSVRAAVLVCLVLGSSAQRVNRERNRSRNRNRERTRDRGNNDNNFSGVRDDFDANILLEKYGYLDDTPGHNHDQPTIAQALREFQQFNGLTVTGHLDQDTIVKMHQPRCGLPDVIKPGQRPSQFQSSDVPGHPVPIAYHAPGYKWNNNRVTYNVQSFTRQLNPSQQSRAFDNAFRKWSDVTPLTFQRTNSRDADIQISYGVREHGDGPGNAFDGRGRTLAHAFFPGDAPISGDTHFDDEEQWTLGEDRGTNLEIVAAHEFGHALGLGHSSHTGALMAPFYKGYDANYQLHQDDIRGIQSLYGGATRPRPTQRPTRATPRTRRTRPTRRPTRPTRRPTRPTRRPTRPTRRPTRPTGRYCRLRFNAIVQIQDGRVLAFKRNKVYTLTRNGPTNETLTRNIFPRAPTNPGAVVYDRYQRATYFFKGRRIWKYRNFVKQRGFPKELPQAFHRVRAAMQWRDGGIYLFIGNQYTRWTEGLRSHSRGYPRRASEYWRGFPSNPESAFRSFDGYYYVFKYLRYWRFNSLARLSNGYPRDSRPVWLNCPVQTNNRRQGQRQRAQGFTANDYSFLTTVINDEATTD